MSVRKLMAASVLALVLGGAVASLALAGTEASDGAGDAVAEERILREEMLEARSNVLDVAHDPTAGEADLDRALYQAWRAAVDWCDVADDPVNCGG